MEKTITIYFTNGKTEQWTRRNLLKYVKDRTSCGHYGDIADFIFFQVQNKQKKN